jgi:hypothetical protein
LLGTAYLHTVTDDHSRVGYAEICADAKATTAIAVLQRAVDFHRTLAHGWAYKRFCGSDAERRAALPGWLHFYNHHRTHSAIGGMPYSRLNNLPGHHIWTANVPRTLVLYFADLGGRRLFARSGRPQIVTQDSCVAPGDSVSRGAAHTCVSNSTSTPRSLRRTL